MRHLPSAKGILLLLNRGGPDFGHEIALFMGEENFYERKHTK